MNENKDKEKIVDPFLDLAFSNKDQNDSYPKFEDTELKRFHAIGKLLYRDHRDRFISTQQLDNICEEYLEPSNNDDIGLVQYMYDYLSYNMKQVTYDIDFFKKKICELIDTNYYLLYK